MYTTIEQMTTQIDACRRAGAGTDTERSRTYQALNGIRRAHSHTRPSAHSPALGMGYVARHRGVVCLQGTWGHARTVGYPIYNYTP